MWKEIFVSLSFCLIEQNDQFFGSKTFAFNFIVIVLGCIGSGRMVIAERKRSASLADQFGFKYFLTRMRGK